VSDENDNRMNERAGGFLSEISIRNHYCLPDLDIAFPPADGKPFRHLMLTGPNGSGKSTVLAKLAETVQSSLSGMAVSSFR
jgi:predicted ATP-binding protein involved in virulence